MRLSFIRASSLTAIMQRNYNAISILVAPLLHTQLKQAPPTLQLSTEIAVGKASNRDGIDTSAKYRE